MLKSPAATLSVPLPVTTLLKVVLAASAKVALETERLLACTSSVLEAARKLRTVPLGIEPAAPMRNVPPPRLVAPV